jgi:hypothetical protein
VVRFLFLRLQEVIEQVCKNTIVDPAWWEYGKSGVYAKLRHPESGKS